MLLDTMLKHVSNAIVVTTSDGDIIQWNPGAHTLFGYAAKEAIGKSIGFILDQQSLPPIRSISSASAEVACHTKAGQTISLSVNFGRLAGGGNNHWYVFEDQRTSAKYDEMLKEKDRAMESFTYSVSHDLRAPLRRIINYAQILEEDHLSSLNEEVARLISRMAKNAEKMSELMDDVLSYSRVSQQPVRKSKVNVNSLIVGVLSDLKKDLGKARVSFSVKPLEDVVADASLLKRVFQNLLDNAIKFSRTSEKPEVEIGCRPGENSIEYYVKDNGVGFDPQYVNKLYSIFQRLHTPAEFEGNGIGLAIVQQIVLRHGGKVWADGKVGRGSTFWFSLPR